MIYVHLSVVTDDDDDDDDDGDIAGYKWCAFVLSVTEINYINFNTQP